MPAEVGGNVSINRQLSAATSRSSPMLLPQLLLATLLLLLSKSLLDSQLQLDPSAAAPFSLLSPAVLLLIGDAAPPEGWVRSPA